MNILDVILTNIVSYMSGILTGLFINYKIKQNKEKNDNQNDNNNNREIEHMDTNTSSVIPTAPAYPVTPPPLALNPECIVNDPKPVTKLVFTTE